MAALLAQKAASSFAGQAVSRRSAVRTPGSRASVVVRAAAAGRPLWAPGVVAPTYLDGTLAGVFVDTAFSRSLKDHWLHKTVVCTRI